MLIFTLHFNLLWYVSWLKFFRVDDLLNKVKELIELRLELFRKELREHTVLLARQLLLVSVVIILMVITMAFASIALAIWLGSLVGSMAGGFALMALLFLLLCIFFVLSQRKTVQKLWRTVNEETPQEQAPENEM